MAVESRTRGEREKRNPKQERKNISSKNEKKGEGRVQVADMGD